MNEFEKGKSNNFALSSTNNSDNSNNDTWAKNDTVGTQGFVTVKKQAFKPFRAFLYNVSSWKVLLVVVLTIALLATLVTLIVLEVNKTTKTSVSDKETKCTTAHENYGNQQFPPLSIYKQYAVAADSKYCSTVGKIIFEKNGSVVDAIIATGLCNSVMNAQSMGIGGGHFLNIYLKEQNASFIIDAREEAPLSSSKNMFLKDPKKALFGLSHTCLLDTVVSQGEIYGYSEAYKIGGRLPWRELFQPAIELCMNGFRLPKALASGLQQREDYIRNDTLLSSIFVDKQTNKLMKENDTVRMPLLGRTFQIISEETSENKSDAFYRGPLTELIVAEMNEHGANVSLEDFRQYKARIHTNRFVVQLNDKYRIYTAPPPSSGLLIAFILKTMMGFGFSNVTLNSNQSSTLFYHRLAETFKHAYAKRTELGDENFLNRTHLEELYKQLADEDYIQKNVRSMIKDDKTFPSSYYGVASETKDTGTAHISIVAPNGDAAGLTSTINNYFGAKYGGKRTGIIYNDGMDDFSTPGVINSFGFVPSPANFIEPRKRSLSSMSPIIIVDDKNDVQLVLGASGGSKIISAVSQVAFRSLILGMNVREAIVERRIHHQLYPEFIELEAGFSYQFQKELQSRGHKIGCFNFGGSVVQGIQRNGPNEIFAYSDPRKGGEPDGL